MAERRLVFVGGDSSSYRSRCCLFGWTFVVLFGGVICVGMPRPPVRPKSPTKCGSRSDYCLTPAINFHMPWSDPPKSSRFGNYNYSLDRNSGEKSRLKADLSSTIFYRYTNALKNNTCIQVLNLTWTVKLNESDLPVIGFRLQYNRFMPSKAFNITDSVLFFLKPGQNMSVDKDGKTMFYHDCLRLSVASKYRFELFSLHESSDHRSVTTGLERPIGALNISTNCDVYPEFHAKPTCDYSNYLNFTPLDRDCSVAAYFIPAPDSFGYTGYDVELRFNNKTIFETRILPFACEDFHPLPFKIVGAGNYRLQVKPVGENCYRYTGVFGSFNVSESDYVCQTTTVATLTTGSVLTLHSTDLPTYEEEVPMAESTAMLSESTFNFRNQNVIIAAATVFVALVVVVAAVVMVFKSRKRRRQVTLCTDDRYSDGIGRDGPEDALTRQPVILISASDNRFHNKAVHCLAAYLQNHCHCDVSLDQWSQQKISEVSALDWIFQQFRSVKNVIIVNSEAGFRQYMETDAAYEKIQHDTPLEDMFVPAMRELRSDYFHRPRSRKLFKVAFPYTDRKFFVNDFHAGVTYQLMTDIEDLALNIHGLTKHSRSGKRAMVGINEMDFTESPEGRELEKAIREAGEYFKQNPNWFSESYRVRPREDPGNVRSPLDTNRPRYTSDPYACCDSGLGTSVENQNFLDSILRDLPEDDEEIVAFTGPDLDDDSSSVSSTNIELQVVMFNQDYDSTLDP